jgi:hypothetical protein
MVSRVTQTKDSQTEHCHGLDQGELMFVAVDRCTVPVSKIFLNLANIMTGRLVVFMELL